MLIKIKKSNGESIAEVLVALLIISLGVVLISTMIVTSSKFIDKSETKLENMYSTVNTLEQNSSNTKIEPNRTFTIKIGNTKKDVKANVYTSTSEDDSISLSSYKIEN